MTITATFLLFAGLVSPVASATNVDTTTHESVVVATFSGSIGSLDGYNTAPIR